MFNLGKGPLCLHL